MKQKKLRQIDVAKSFLYTPVDLEIFVEQPQGSNTDPYQVCQLLKSLYGIKQAPRVWQQYLHARFIRIGFQQLPHDQGMHRLTKEAEYILLIVYVDDLLYIGSTDNITTSFEEELQQDLSLTVSSTVTQYLGLNILDGKNAIYLNTAKYANTITKRFELSPALPKPLVEESFSLLTSGVAIFDLDYDAILAAKYALSVSAKGDYYLCVPPDPGIEVAALGASESALPGTTPAEALHTFMLDSRASGLTATKWEC
ncbi:unnamed protein product [Closterium sp. NIES-54]